MNRQWSHNFFQKAKPGHTFNLQWKRNVGKSMEQYSQYINIQIKT